MPAEPTEQKGQAGIEDLRRPTDKNHYIWLHMLHSLTFGSLYIRRHVLVKGG